MSALIYDPRPQFVEFHNRGQRWASLNTHRRAGKTVTLINDLILGALECSLRRPQLAYIGPTFTQAKRVAWQYLKDYSERYWEKDPSESELKVHLKGGRVIYCLGSDKADSLRGMYLDGAVGDEYALWRPSVFSKVLRPALSDRNGWFVFASTPRGKNLFHEIHKQALADPDHYYALNLKASHSGILSQLELNMLRKDMDPDEYAQEYECSFDAALKGAIYSNEVNELFHDKRVLPRLYDANLPTHVVFDLGFTDATVATYWQETKDGWLDVVSCQATQGEDIMSHIDSLNQFTGELGDIWLPHDARARNLQTGLSMVEQFLENGLRPQVVPAHKVRDRIAATRRIFPKVRIAEEDTGDLVEALKNYRRKWSDELRMLLDKPEHDWSSDFADSFGYMAVVAGTKGLTGANVRAQKSSKDKDKASTYNLNSLFADYEQRNNAMLGRIA